MHFLHALSHIYECVFGQRRRIEMISIIKWIAIRWREVYASGKSFVTWELALMFTVTEHLSAWATQPLCPHLPMELSTGDATFFTVRNRCLNNMSVTSSCQNTEWALIIAHSTPHFLPRWNCCLMLGGPMACAAFVTMTIGGGAWAEQFILALAEPKKWAPIKTIKGSRSSTTPCVCGAWTYQQSQILQQHINKFKAQSIRS